MAKLKSLKLSKDDTPKKEQRKKDSSVTRATRARSRSASMRRTKSFTPNGRTRANSLVSIPHSQSTSLDSSHKDSDEDSLSNHKQEKPEHETTTPTATNDKRISSSSGGNHDSNSDSNGIFSSIINVAHNAANIIGSSIDNKTATSPEPDTADDLDEKSSSFSHKLDFLLKPANFGKNSSSSFISKKSKSSRSDSQTDAYTPRGSEDSQDKRTHVFSNVHFKTVKESPLQTLGNGNLRLDDFEEAPFTRNGPSQSTENLIPSEIKRNALPDNINQSMPLSNELAVSGNNENKKVSRKSLSNGTSLERIKSPESRKKMSADMDDSEASERGSSNSIITNSDDDLNEILDISTIKPASEKRNKEFHQIFKRIPPNEKLIDEFSCALSKDILVQGKMYLSEHYICFNSNILGWVTNIIIPLQEVIQIEKKSTAVLFPNGMIIRTLYHKYVFATFLSRDATFVLITNVWHSVLLGDNSDMNSITDKKENDKHGSGDSITNDERLSNGISLKNDDEHDEDDSDGDISKSGASSLESILANGAGNNETKDVKPPSMIDGLSNNKVNGLADGDNNKSPKSFHGLPAVGPLTHTPTEIDYTKLSDETFISDDILKAPLGVVFLILFGPDNSKFAKILKEQGNYDINEDGITELSTSSKERNYTYTKPLNGPIGPKKTKCIIKDKLVEYDINKYILVEQITTTPDVPSGNSFQVKTKIFLSWAENNCTRLYSLTIVEWSGKSWIKGAIEKGSIDGQKESMKSMTDSINLIIGSGGAGEASAAAKPDKKKRKRAKSDITQKSVERAPEPEKTSLQQLQAFVEAVGKAYTIPFIGELASGIILLSVALIAFMEVYNLLFHRRASSLDDLQILSQDSVVSKIKVNNDKYFVIPSVESYFKNKQAKIQNEVAIWDWVNDRSEGALNILNQESPESNLQLYSNQEMKEIVRIVQLKIDEINNRMNSDHI